MIFPDDLPLLLGFYFAGLGLNLTPCVYPLLAVTVSLFSRGPKITRAHAFSRALLYVGGMAVMYSVLGVSAAFAGNLFGSFLQHPGVLLGISAILLLLGLGMMGLYSFQFPNALLQGVPKFKGAGGLGFFLSGLFAGIFAAPCIGPPIVGLLTVVGERAEPFFGFLSFFVLSLGLGTPYLLLGTFSGLLQKLPRSGFWLVGIERLFGIILFGLAGFYAVLALKPEWVDSVVPALFVAGGVYLGFVERHESYTENFVRLKRSIGFLAVVLGFLMGTHAPRERVVWEPYLEERLTSARQAGKPVIIDFYADWCIPCHELERFTYSDPRVIRALEGFERLKADVTNIDDEQAQAAVGRFDVLGVPTILLLDRQGNEVEGTRVTGFIPAEDLLVRIEAVNPAAQSDDNEEASAPSLKGGR